jgi:hypothetical protein
MVMRVTSGTASPGERGTVLLEVLLGRRFALLEP